MSTNPKSKYEQSDHYDGQRFYNQDRSTNVEKGLSAVLKWKTTSKAKKWPKFVDDNVEPKLDYDLKQGEGAVTFINHASNLIQFQNHTIITDPVFSERVSPMSWAGPKRHRKVGVELDALPPISIVLISHNHYDHMDMAALKAIYKQHKPLFITPLGNKKYLAEHGIENIVELDWWQSYSLDHSENSDLNADLKTDIKTDIKISLVPMQHWSSRSLSDRFQALWGGFVIETSGLKVLFSGDTGYNQHFKQIHEKFGAMDFSLIPIGAYEPRWFMKDAHMNPDDAIQAHLDLHSKQSMAIHFGTFQLTDEGIDDPEKDLNIGLEKEGVDAQKFIVPKNGQTVRFGRGE